MTNNLVKRLREVGNKNGLMYADYDTTIEAADEIERLNAENARLREALEQIASGGLFQHAHEFARAALAEKGEK